MSYYTYRELYHTTELSQPLRAGGMYVLAHVLASIAVGANTAVLIHHFDAVLALVLAPLALVLAT